jgi:cell division protein FtsB
MTWQKLQTNLLAVPEAHYGGQRARVANARTRLGCAYLSDILGAVDPAPYPAAPSRPSRIRIAVRHPERTAALLAILIGFASVFSAVIAWRASLASIDASRYQSLAVQQQARREQIERDLEATVQQDERFVADFQEHALAARELQTQADSIRATNTTAADTLDLQAQSELALTRALEPFFMGAGGVALDENGTVPYDKAFVLTNLEDGDVELRELRTSNVANLANAANAKSIDFIAVAAVVVAALFFLTVAQVSRTRVKVRQAFFVSGGLLVLVGVLAFVFVEIVT